MRQTVHWSKSALSRRRFLPAGRATLVTGTVSSLSPRGSAAATVALRQLAAEKGLLDGTTIVVAQITGDRPFTDLVRHRIAKVDQEPIPEQLGDMPIVALDNVGTHPLIRTDHVPVLFGIELAGETRGVHEVTKHHRKLPSLRLR